MPALFTLILEMVLFSSLSLVLDFHLGLLDNFFDLFTFPSSALPFSPVGDNRIFSFWTEKQVSFTMKEAK